MFLVAGERNRRDTTCVERFVNQAGDRVDLVAEALRTADSFAASAAASSSRRSAHLVMAGVDLRTVQAVRRHLRPLSAEAREILTTAAVVGREFDRGVVARAHGLDAPFADGARGTPLTTLS